MRRGGTMREQLERELADLRRGREELEQRVAQRTAALVRSNRELAASRSAALNMMQDAVEAQRALEAINRDLEREIAERKRGEAEIRRLNVELEQRVRQRTAELEVANKELQSFSYSVSHDLRAPLRRIDGFSRILLEDHGPALAAEARHYAERIRAGTRRMGELIEALLGLSRVTRHAIVLADVNLSELAHGVVADLRKAAPDREATFVIQPRLLVGGDRNLLRDALENLLGNAWKYTSTRARPCIEFGCRSEDGESVYFLRDNGVGFDMAHAGKLFIPFQRLHSDAEFEGTGIGLATVQRIICRHGGRIWADAAPGQGATFFFTLPPASDPAAPMATGARRRRP